MRKQLTIACAVLFMLTSAAWAGEKPWEKFSLNIGGYFASVDSSVMLEGVPGGTIDGEDTLGLDENVTVPRIDFVWRFSGNRKHRFDGSWYAINRDATKTASKEIPIGDHVFKAGAQVDSRMDMSAFKIGYSYSLWQTEKIDFGVGLGVYIMPFKFDIRAKAGVGIDDKVITVGGHESIDITAPLPILDLRFDYAFTPKLFLKNKLDVFYMSYKDFSGSLIDYTAVLEYNIWKNVGIGGGFNYFSGYLESDEGDVLSFVGEVDISHLGALFYAKIMF